MRVAAQLGGKTGMSSAPPRKNANRDCSIRPYRTGSRSAIRDAACDSSRSTGSGRFGAGT
jgi:hypothetical protein